MSGGTERVVDRLPRRGRPVVAVAALAIAGMLSAGCGAATNSLDPGRQQIGIAKKGSLGRVLVDGDGQTLYVFAKDPKKMSTCYGACASVWPPVTTEGKPMAASGVASSKLSTIKRDDGTTQVAYNGHALYYYQADTDPDDADGQGVSQFGAPWFVESASGSVITKGGGGSGS
jgi:predicted lipoprotein with Yx(FWY)xxD motif